MFRRLITPAAILAVIVAALAAPALAREVVKGDLTLWNLEVRASLGINPNTAGYMTVSNKGAADELIGVSCTCAREVQIHVMSMDGGVMSMSRLSRLPVPAHGQLKLGPGGAHLMILGLKKPVAIGERVKMTLTFRRAGKVETSFRVVRAPGDDRGR